MSKALPIEPDESKLTHPRPDSDKNFLKTGRDNQVTAFWIKDIQYTTLGKFIIYRLLHDRDIKMVITSKGKTTGTGKTTLAIILAKWINKVRNDLFDMQKSWEAKEYAFMDIWEYLTEYKEAQPGDVLITDELEYLADRRRHATHQNVKFSQAWSMLRYKNVVTIGTAPGLMDLEKRIPEGADIWINVTMTGRANVYYLTVDDFEWKPVTKRLKMFGFRESILWKEIEKSDDYQFLKQEKEDKGVPGIDDMSHLDESDLKQKEKDLKMRFAKDLLKILHEKGNIRDVFTQEEIADTVGYSQQQVSKIERNMKKEGKLATA